MNHIIQHIPPFVDGVEPEHASFDGLEELLVIDWVKRWKSKPHRNSGEFHQFSLSGSHLMVELEDGAVWYVIGHVRRPDLLDLPKWDSGKAHEKERLLREKVESGPNAVNISNLEVKFGDTVIVPASGEFVTVTRKQGE